MLRFAAPTQTGDATKLMPREQEIKRPIRPMRFKTTSLLADHADRPFSAARKEQDMKLKRAVAKCALQLALPVCLDKPLIWLGQVVKIK